MKNSIALLLIVAVIGIAGFFLFTKNDTAPVTTVEDTPAEAPLEATATGETEWLTYENTRYGYSVRYPSNYTPFVAVDAVTETVTPPNESSTEVFITNTKERLFCCQPLMTSISIVEGSINMDEEVERLNVPSYRFISQEDITFNGMEAVEIRANSGTEFPFTRIIIIPREPYSFIIKQGDNTEDWTSMTDSFSITQ